MIPAGIVLLSLSTRTVALPREAQAAVVRVKCPVYAETRVSLPEPLRQLRGPRDDRQLWGIAIQSTRPRATLVVRPVSHPLATRLEFRGATSVIVIELETVIAGRASELRMEWENGHGPRPANGTRSPDEQMAAGANGANGSAPSSWRSAPPPSLEPATVPEPARLPLGRTVDISEQRDRPVPALYPRPAPTASDDALTASEMLWARPITIGRREGLPGQPEMVLVDALRGEQWLWLRFRLAGGAKRRLARVGWEHGALASYDQAKDGNDLRAVVRLPRARVTRQTRVSLEMEDGPIYRFALSAPTLGGLLRSLFK